MFADVFDVNRGDYLRPAWKANWNNKRIKDTFKCMIYRCYKETNKDYRWYGAKGIKICDEWINAPKLFEEWVMDNGYADDLTIDRIDSNKDYSPDNCRWVSNEYNAKYKSTTNIITVNGECHTGHDWAKILNIGTNVINTYIRLYGMDDTIEFIKRFLNNPELATMRKRNESFFDLYMS